MNKIVKIYNEIYGDLNLPKDFIKVFNEELINIKAKHFSNNKDKDKLWYKDVVIYSMYVDLFNKNMDGLIDKLDELTELGITCLWLLPILESPMKDAGFDISDYEKVRDDLLGTSDFEKVIEEAHKRGIKIIFDIAMNHCSMEHKWFQEARLSKSSKYRDFFIWSDNKDKYSDARIIFKGLCSSNWEFDELTKQYYYHRFFEIQPDLNYRNPEVLLSMTKILINWKIKGIDGFRADAVPFIWKEEGTICENLPKTHKVVQFMRAVLDYLEEGTLLLAEACQPPKEVVTYFGNEDECQAAYHFPVMPRIYRALAEESKEAIETSLSSEFTPNIPDSCQWFMFLRCHDELTLEMVTPKERKIIYDYYVKNQLWDFREGEGISARVSELFEFNVDRIKLAYSIMFTLLGTPIIYYGDEYGKGNDVKYFEEFSAMTGYKDSRYLVRGPIKWEQVDKDMNNKNSVAYKVNKMIKQMTAARKKHLAFARGSLEFVSLTSKNGQDNRHILSYIREYKADKILVIQNLSGVKQTVSSDLLGEITTEVLTDKQREHQETITLNPYDIKWFNIND